MTALFKYLGFLLYANMLAVGIAYIYLLKIRRRIGFHTVMNSATITGGFLAVVTGVILIYQFPLHYVLVTIVTTVVGMGAGALFGGLFDFKTLITGYTNGLMMGLMSPMIGAVAKNSTLFLLFIEVLFIFSIFLVICSSRKELYAEDDNDSPEPSYDK
ncbi:hypothetical protein DCC39_12270 [Pueribacillus theae]|uniref:Uncharacterized protein n=1 Tax=Pueribacillus theae TaxID=2171751 RepID=A0A2U1JWZ4_9BACI|nr:hypothetical protein DCC39_12270 [Pueribacillus theae]